MVWSVPQGESGSAELCQRIPSLPSTAKRSRRDDQGQCRGAGPPNCPHPCPCGIVPVPPGGSSRSGTHQHPAVSEMSRSGGQAPCSCPCCARLLSPGVPSFVTPACPWGYGLELLQVPGDMGRSDLVASSATQLRRMCQGAASACATWHGAGGSVSGGTGSRMRSRQMTQRGSTPSGADTAPGAPPRVRAQHPLLLLGCRYSTRCQPVAAPARLCQPGAPESVGFKAECRASDVSKKYTAGHQCTQKFL